MTLTLRDWASGHSFLHRMESRWKIAAVLAAAVAVLLSDNVCVAAFACLSTVFWLRCAGLPWNWSASRLVSVAAFLIVLALVLPLSVGGEGWTVGPVRISYRGMELAALIIARALTVSGLGLLILATTPLDQLQRGLLGLFVPGLVVQLLSMSLRYVYLLGEVLSGIRRALRIRGYRHRFSRHSYHTTACVMGSLLVRSQRRAERVAQAMRCRGFSGKWRLLPARKPTASDIVLALSLVASIWLVPWLAFTLLARR